MLPYKELYRSCILETNPEDLLRLIHETEDAIVLRLKEIAHDPWGARERNEISEAKADLFSIKSRRLGSPDLPQSA